MVPALPSNQTCTQVCHTHLNRIYFYYQFVAVDESSVQSGEDTGTGTERGAELDPLGLALAEQMFLSKSMREDIIDGAYNRYTNRDQGLDIPDWFLEDEQKHSYKILPVTKQQVCGNGIYLGILLHSSPLLG